MWLINLAQKVRYTVSIVGDDRELLKFPLPGGPVQSYIDTRRRPEPHDLFILVRTVQAVMQQRLSPCKVVNADDHLTLRQPFAHRL